ncbi:MAG: sxtJ [Pseudomonadales bacterium]|nr:sxtJ [Pseudomonadales bacterium]MCP5183075.1 sxtJ [Pseudomonadales bacterium]
MANHDIPDLDTAGLRRFGLTTGGLLVGVFGLLLPWLVNANHPMWPWIIGGGMALWGLALPNSLRPVYRAWMQFGLMMSRVTTPLVLGVAFYLVITPLGLIMRAIGHKPVSGQPDPDATTYRVVNDPGANRSLERPF